MADRKISDLTALTTPASGDFLPIVDISEAAAASKNKRITIEELMRGVPDGTAAAPGIAFETDPNTGIYSPGADQLAVSTGGTGRLFISSTGLVGIGTSAPATLLHLNSAAATNTTLAYSENGALKWYNRYSAGDGSFQIVDVPNAAVRLHVSNTGNVGIGTASPDSLLHAVDGSGNSIRVGFGPSVNNFNIYDAASHLFRNAHGGTERARIDSSGRLLIGTSTSRGDGSPLQIVNDSGNPIEVFRGATDVSSSALLFNKSRGSTATPTIVSSGDGLGAVVFKGHDGTAYRDAAFIVGVVDGTPGASDMPGRLVFSTTADGAASPTERMRIDSTGLVTLAGPGIKFPATQVASADPNTLDDYEEGTFTPGISFGGGTTGISYTGGLVGTYVKIGRVVYVTAAIQATSDGTSTGNLSITGLPFTAANATGIFSASGYGILSVCSDSGANRITATSFSSSISSGAQTIQCFKTVSAVTAPTAAITDVDCGTLVNNYTASIYYYV